MNFIWKVVLDYNDVDIRKVFEIICEFRIISMDNVYIYCFVRLSFSYDFICYVIYWIGGVSFELLNDIVFVE